MLILLAACTFAATAQKTRKSGPTPNAPEVHGGPHPLDKFYHWSLDFLAGPAFPVGGYAGLDKGVPGGGPVHPGGVAELSGTCHLSRSFGIVLLAGGQLNKGNGIPYAQPPKPLPPGTLPGAEIVTLYNGQYWAIARFMTGGEYTLPLTPKNGLNLLLRVLGGAQTTKPADYNYYFPDNGGRISYHYVSLPWSFSYQIDAGLKWQYRRRMALIAYAGYNGSQPSRSFTYLVSGSSTIYSYYSIQAKIPTSSLLFRAGIDIGL